MKKTALFLLTASILAATLGCHRVARVVSPGSEFAQKPTRAERAALAAIPKSMNAPVENKVRMANVRTTFVKHSDVKTYKLNLQRVPEVYKAEIKYYTENALKYLGYAPAENAPVLVTVEVAAVQANGRRVPVMYKVEAAQNGAQIWSMQASCNGDKRIDVNYYFPGLVAAGLAYFGENRVQPVHNVPKYPIYLQAVTLR